MAHVLLVEDEQDVAEPISRALRYAGHKVIAVPDGREALALVMATTPDVILLDLRLPQMDGTTFLSILRSYLRLNAIPVFIVTALPNGVELDRALDLGVDRLFRKGQSDLNEIVTAVNDLTKPTA